jgi:hypothetical protein
VDTILEPSADNALVRSLKNWSLWLGGSIAGLSVICYGAGYFLFHAHLQMLGLSEIVALPQEQMLLEGARFFFSVFSIFFEDGLVLGAVIVIAMATIAVVHEFPRLASAIARTRMSIIDRWQRLTRRSPTLNRTITLVVLVVALTLHTDAFFYPLREVSGIENMLFKDQTSSNVTAEKQPSLKFEHKIIGLIQSGSDGRNALKDEYRTILDGYLILLVGVWLTFARSQRTGAIRASPIVRLIVVSYALVMTLLLPVGFGVMVRAPVAPTVEVTLSNGKVLRGAMLENGNNHLVLWFPTLRRAGWYSSSSIGSIQVLGETNLFDLKGKQR